MPSQVAQPVRAGANPAPDTLFKLKDPPVGFVLMSGRHERPSGKTKIVTFDRIQSLLLCEWKNSATPKKRVRELKPKTTDCRD